MNVELDRFYCISIVLTALPIHNTQYFYIHTKFRPTFNGQTTIDNPQHENQTEKTGAEHNGSLVWLGSYLCNTVLLFDSLETAKLYRIVQTLSSSVNKIRITYMYKAFGMFIRLLDELTRNTE